MGDDGTGVSGLDGQGLVGVLGLSANGRSGGVGTNGCVRVSRVVGHRSRSRRDLLEHLDEKDIWSQSRGGLMGCQGVGWTPEGVHRETGVVSGPIVRQLLGIVPTEPTPSEPFSGELLGSFACGLRSLGNGGTNWCNGPHQGTGDKDCVRRWE